MLIMVQTFSFAQTPTIEWAKCYGGSNEDYAYSTQQTTDSGYIVAGYTYSTDGDVSGNHSVDTTDYWIVKLDATGDTVWTKCLGGSGYDYAGSIRQATDGGYIVAGYTFSTDGDVSGNHGDYDYWIVKLDATGDTVWTRCLGGSSSDYTESIRQTTDGGYIVAGDSESTDGDVSGNHGNNDYWIVKLSSDVSIEEITGNSFIKIYPNPTGKWKIVNCKWKMENGKNEGEIEIYNIYGQKVYEKKVYGSQRSTEIKLDELPAGVYIVQLKTKQKILSREKLIVK